MITNKADASKFDGEIRGEVGNYDTRRLRGFVNVPIGDTLAVRVAGVATRRDGFDYNSITENRVNGRDLWQVRGSVRWQPTERFPADFVYEHFNENDDRSRTGKQLCHRDPGPSSVGGVAVADATCAGILSQGCRPGSLYDDAAYGVPNGLSLQLVTAAQNFAIIGYKQNPNFDFPNPGDPVYLLQAGVDPNAGTVQSTDLREIASQFDPVFAPRTMSFS